MDTDAINVRIGGVLSQVQDEQERVNLLQKDVEQS
jgi:hypothetical protein